MTKISLPRRKSEPRVRRESVTPAITPTMVNAPVIPPDYLALPSRFQSKEALRGGSASVLVL
jgi:hypothetical protein